VQRAITGTAIIAARASSPAIPTNHLSRLDIKPPHRSKRGTAPPVNGARHP